MAANLQRYEVLESLGEGTFGAVKKVRDKESGDFLAMKCFKQRFKSWDACLELRELRALKKLVHPNIVRLREVIRKESGELYMLFEFCAGNVSQLLAASRPSNTAIASIMLQVFKALSHMHRHGFFHRDLKPENLLYTAPPPSAPESVDPESVSVKVADFGLAREVRSRPPYTQYVSTRWYRAPEILVGILSYNSPVDVWAAGCIMAELFTQRPLFPGASESDVLFRIASVLGSPTAREWPEGADPKTKQGWKWPNVPSPTGIAAMLEESGAPVDAVAIIQACLQWSPQRRPSADAVLQMKWFAGVDVKGGSGKVGTDSGVASGGDLTKSPSADGETVQTDSVMGAGSFGAASGGDRATDRSSAAGAAIASPSVVTDETEALLRDLEASVA